MTDEPPAASPDAGHEIAEPPAKPDGRALAAAATRKGGVTGLSRLQVLGVLFGLLGAALVLAVAGRLDDQDVRLTFGLGDLAPSLTLDPPRFTRAVGALIALAGAAAIADRWTKRLAGLGLIAATALLAPLVLVVALALSTSASSLNLLPLLSESLRLATPIALGSLAGLFAERSGVVNIGIEGMMLAGAGVGFVVYAFVGAGLGGGALYLGILAAIVVGGAMAALHAMLCVTFRTDQIVSGVAINLLAIGITSFLRREVLLDLGVGGAATLRPIALPGLSSLPIIGPLFVGKPIFWTMFVVFVLTQLVLFRTAWGLRVRSVGEHPHAAETLGINVVKMRYQSVIIGGLIAGLAGAWFSLETVGSFEDVMTQGAGFIALAALIFGKWRPWPAFGGALLFGFTTALGSRIQLLSVEIGGYPIPSAFLQSVPYVVTIAVLAGAIGRAIPPASVGIPYRRER
ncbi:MAG TPA: ABC transporter permease [Egibacteraceae bacterium]|nr:ABC transporter permease [Egibacteraceae bacterium]